MPAGGEKDRLTWSGEGSRRRRGPEADFVPEMRARDSVLGVLLDVVGRVERRRHFVR